MHVLVVTYIRRILFQSALISPIHAAICCNPVYVHPHSKCVLMQAVLADTEFLAQNAIMDYSLLTCIDDASGELVVGIIGTKVLPYSRTFSLG